MRTVAVVQARMGSTRLPGKVLADVCGRPMLAHVLERAARARLVDEVLVATSTASADDAVAACCEALGVACHRGSEDDVLDRYYRAAEQARADVVVRITADCPLLDPALVDRVVDALRERGADYAANVLECTYPDGLDVEAFTRGALATAWREARLRSEREHVTPYLRNHPERFRLASVTGERDFSVLRWTVDEPRDLEFVRRVYARLGARPFGLAELLALLEAEPELVALNQDIPRNEGYLKSLREDGVMQNSEVV